MKILALLLTLALIALPAAAQDCISCWMEKPGTLKI